jgi:hypothetical protein
MGCIGARNGFPKTSVRPRDLVLSARELSAHPEPHHVDRARACEDRHPPLEVEPEKAEMVRQKVHRRFLARLRFADRASPAQSAASVPTVAQSRRDEDQRTCKPVLHFVAAWARHFRTDCTVCRRWSPETRRGFRSRIFFIGFTRSWPALARAPTKTPAAQRRPPISPCAPT